MRRRSSGEGSIYRGKDGRWYASLEVGTRWHRRRRRFVGATRERVRQKLIAVQREQGHRPGSSRDELLTIEQIAKAWLAYKEPRVAHLTHSYYSYVAEKYIVPRFGTTKKHLLTPRMIDTALAAWAKAPRKDKRKGELSASTLHHILVALRVMLNWAVRMREIPYNPALAVEAPRAEQQHHGEALTPAEFADLLAFAQTWKGGEYATILLVAAATGARRGELCALRWGDIDVASSTVTIARSAVVLRDRSHRVTVKEPKGAKTATVSVPSLVLEALAQRYESQRARLGRTPDSETPAFDDGQGRLRSPQVLGDAIARLIADWAKQESEGGSNPLDRRPIRLHDLRHSYGSWLANLGASDRVLRAQLRHVSPAMTDRYTEHLDPGKKAAADALDSLLRGVLGASWPSTWPTTSESLVGPKNEKSA